MSVVSRASIHWQAHEMTMPHAPDELPNGCFGDLAPFLKYISKVIDVLWLVRLSLDMFCKDVLQIFSWRQAWGLHWPWKSHGSTTLQVTLDSTFTRGSGIVLED